MRNFTGFTIFDSTDPNFYSGKLSTEFSKESDDGARPWFFQPDNWVPNGEHKNYGSILANRFKTLMTYSPGFATREEAQVAADDWLKTLLEEEASPETASMNLFLGLSV